MTWTVHHGDALETLRGLPANSFDGLFCDPPYGLSFMGKAWDHGVPSVEVWREALRVLKPGAPLLAFGGTRTFHRLTVTIEDAGFEIRDCLMWLYGSGFPKSQNVAIAIDKNEGLLGHRGHGIVVAGQTGGLENPRGAEAAKLWDGRGTALKPSWEPVILARKPLDGTMVENVARWGVGPISIDACRIGRAAEPKGRWPANLMLSHDHACVRTGTRKVKANGPSPENAPRVEGNVYGRYEHASSISHRGPDGTETMERWECVAGCPVRLLDEQAGERKSGVAVLRNGGGGKIFNADKGQGVADDAGYSDAGGASRFFFCAKVSTFEREFGCDNLSVKTAGECTDREDDTAGLDSPRAGASRGNGARNNHPTMKPISLCKYLATLIKPPTGGRLLVPYSGSGSEMIGAMRAGWAEIVGIEQDAEYLRIAEARLKRWSEVPANVDPMDSKPEPTDEHQIGLFG